MTPLHFTPTEIDRLRFERFPHPHPLIQRKREALLLKSEGLPQPPIARILGICENTLRSYCAPYQSGGVEALEELNCYQPESALEGHRSSLQAHFQDHPPAGVKEAAALIEARTGLRRSLSPVRQFLQRLGLGRRQIGSVPAQADGAQPAAFPTQTLEPRWQAARAGTRAVFLVEAAHWVFAPLLGFWWSCTRLFVKARPAAGASTSWARSTPPPTNGLG